MKYEVHEEDVVYSGEDLNFDHIPGFPVGEDFYEVLEFSVDYQDQHGTRSRFRAMRTPRITKYARMRGISFVHIAEEVGFSVERLRSLRNIGSMAGGTKDFNDIIRISEILDVDVEDLLSYNDMLFHMSDENSISNWGRRASEANVKKHKGIPNRKHPVSEKTPERRPTEKAPDIKALEKKVDDIFSIMSRIEGKIDGYEAIRYKDIEDTKRMITENGQILKTLREEKKYTEEEPEVTYPKRSGIFGMFS